MPDDALREVTITLTRAQVRAVLRAAGDGRTPVLTVPAQARCAPPDARAAGPPDAGEGPLARSPRSTGEAADRRLSRSLLRGLALLGRFGPDPRGRGIVELAAELGISPSTAHRYAQTLLELGLLERCPGTRRYRLPAPARD